MDGGSVLVTGSSGSVGTALCERLLEGSFDVTAVDIEPNRWSETVDARTESVDLLREDSVDDLPKDVDIVVHLAAHSRVQTAIENPTEAIENLRMTQHVLEYARRNSVPVLFTSSREVYGAGGETVHAEAGIRTRDCANPYGASKIGGEALTFAYRNSYDLDVGVVRLSNVYGRYDTYDRVVPIFISKALAGEELTVYGSGKVLDFLFIDDCVDGLRRAIERFELLDGEAVNLGSGRGTSLVELASMVTDAVPDAAGYRVEGDRSGEVGKFVADTEKAERLLGFTAERTFEDGLEEAIEWYRRADIAGERS